MSRKKFAWKVVNENDQDPTLFRIGDYNNNNNNLWEQRNSLGSENKNSRGSNFPLIITYSFCNRRLIFVINNNKNDDNFWESRFIKFSTNNNLFFLESTIYFCYNNNNNDNNFWGQRNSLGSENKNNRGSPNFLLIITYSF